jgi:hypothetical protein
MTIFNSHFTFLVCIANGNTCFLVLGDVASDRGARTEKTRPRTGTQQPDDNDYRYHSQLADSGLRACEREPTSNENDYHLQFQLKSIYVRFLNDINTDNDYH